MDDRIIHFYLYRYHLLPIEPDPSEIFPRELPSVNEIKAKKNHFFENVLTEYFEKEQFGKHPIKLENSDEDYFLLKIAQKKTTKLAKNFHVDYVSHEPFVYVIVNNDPESQLIAISHDVDAFSSTDVVKNILRKTLQRDLKTFGLNIEIEQRFKSEKFWEIINHHKYSVEYIDFKYIKPNLANISGSLPKAFKEFSESVNSHESHLSIKAPKKGVLKNIEKSNTTVNGLVKYTSEGAGAVRVKIKGIKEYKMTEEHPVVREIDELDLKGSADQIIKLYKTIVSE